MKLESFKQRPVLPSPIQVNTGNNAKKQDQEPSEQIVPAHIQATSQAPVKARRSSKRQSQLPQVGEQFRAKIVRINKKTGEVELELPESFEDSSGEKISISRELRDNTGVIIPPQSQTGGGYKVGNARWVEVVSVLENGKVLEVKPVKKENTVE